MVELLTVVGLIAGVVAAHEIGFWLGGLIGSTDEVFDRQLALIRNSTAAVVAFLIAFGRRRHDRGLHGRQRYLTLWAVMVGMACNLLPDGR
jgi:hypothetical protein